MTYFQKLVVNTMAFISLSVIFSSMFYVSSIFIAIAASVVLSVLNMLVKPLLHILSLPITILTFGLFSLVINGIMLKLTSLVVGTNHFSFSSFGSALFIAILLSIINAFVADHHSNKRNYD